MLVRTCFLLFACGFIIGDIIGVTLVSGGIYMLICITGALLVANRIQRWALYALFFGGVIGYQIGHLAIEEKHAHLALLREYTGNYTLKRSVVGSVGKILYSSDRTNTYLLKIDNFDNIKNVGKLSIFLEIPKNLTLQKGDTIEFSGKIQENILYPLRGYSRYALFHGGYGKIFLTEFRHISHGPKNSLESIRKSLQNRLERYFEEDISGILMGMMVGSVELLDSEVKKAFINSGISHILVVSGSNIAFLIITLVFFLKYLPLSRKNRLTIIIPILIFYGFLVGWEAPVVRATTMGLLSFIIVEYGGISITRSLIALAGVILTLIFPLAPVYDAGFGLSFSATIGIILFHTPIDGFCKKLFFPKILSSICAITGGATLGSIPLLIYHFEKLQLSGILVNLLIGGLLGWILFCGLIFISFHWISHIFSTFFGILIYIPIKIILSLALFFQYGLTLTVRQEFILPITLSLLGIYLSVFLEKEIQFLHSK